MTREEKDFMILGISSFGVKHQEDFDINIGGVSVSIFWHYPSINVGWYPIAQIDRFIDGNWETVFRGEGAENPELWQGFANDLCLIIRETIREE